MSTTAPASDLERRKMVRLRRRADLHIVPRYEGHMYTSSRTRQPAALSFRKGVCSLLMDLTRLTLSEGLRSLPSRRLKRRPRAVRPAASANGPRTKRVAAGGKCCTSIVKRVKMEWMQTLTTSLIKIRLDPEAVTKMLLAWWMFTKTVSPPGLRSVAALLLVLGTSNTSIAGCRA